MICTCVRCGAQFEAKRKTAVCANCHTAVCVICGKEFQLQTPWTQKTCSSKCRAEYVKQSGIAKERAKKASATVKKNGTVHVFTKKCAYCGKEFQTTSSRQIYCNDIHYGPCPVCGKPVVIKEMYIGPQACSKECKKVATRATCLERYGSTTAVNSDHARAKAKQTCLTKYGVEHPSQSIEYREKYEATMLDRYGVKYPLQNVEIRAQVSSTNLVRYGGASPTCNKNVSQRAQSSLQLRWGGCGLASDTIRSKITDTMLDRYGAEHPMQVPCIVEKLHETCLSRYGTRNFGASDEAIKRRMIDPAKFDNYIQFRSNPQQYITSNFTYRPTINQLTTLLGVTDTPIYDILIKNNCRELVCFHGSTMENELVEFILNLDSSIKVFRNARTVISPQEIDIYLPEYHIGIECNPTITHNSSRMDPWSGAPKHYRYHQQKSIDCRNNGVFLFHVFGYEWTWKRDIILSMIKNLLGKSDARVFARNTQVVELTDSECREFLNANHRQGAMFASIRLGLKDKQTHELVSVMTFNKIRSTIGKKSSTVEFMELSRFCSRLNTCVVGGASKLFSYYLKHHLIHNVVSFSDVAHTRGNLYAQLGFVRCNESAPSYVWVDSITDKALNRVECQKSNLVKLLDEPDLDLSQTERQIMESHGYLRVYDSGTVRWEYHPN